MIPTGISPTEAAFEVIGLVNAKSIIDFLFFETRIGLAVFLIGLLTALWRSAKETDFSVLWSYLFMFCIILFIFIKPMASLESATSTMETAGWKGTSTQEALKEAFIDSSKARAGSLGLIFISQGYNAIIYGTISAITKVTQQQDFNYLNKTYTALKKYPDAAANNNFFDILSVHPYCDDRPPESADPSFVWSNMDRNFSGLPKMKMAMENQGDVAKHIIVTEFGWVVTDISWTKGVGYVNQADFLKRAYAMAQNWTWLDAMMWYGFKNWDNSEGPYSLVNTDLSPRLSYDAFKSIAIQPPPTDTSSPSVSINTPTNNATVSGTINITASASDNVQVSRVDFFVDGNYKGVDSATPYNYAWDSKTVSGGLHTLKAKAYDTSGLSAESSVTINVSNTPLILDTIPPVVTIVSPANNSSLYSPGFTTIVTDVTDNVAVAKVEFYVDGVLTSTVNAAPYQYGWRLKKNNRGVHIINVKAYDSSSLTSTSQITVTIK